MNLPIPSNPAAEAPPLPPSVPLVELWKGDTVMGLWLPVRREAWPERMLPTIEEARHKPGVPFQWYGMQSDGKLYRVTWSVGPPVIESAGPVVGPSVPVFPNPAAQILANAAAKMMTHSHGPAETTVTQSPPAPPMVPPPVNPGPMVGMGVIRETLREVSGRIDRGKGEGPLPVGALDEEPLPQTGAHVPQSVADNPKGARVEKWVFRGTLLSDGKGPRWVQQSPPYPEKVQKTIELAPPSGIHSVNADGEGWRVVFPDAKPEPKRTDNPDHKLIAERDFAEKPAFTYLSVRDALALGVSAYYLNLSNSKDWAAERCYDWADTLLRARDGKRLTPEKVTGIDERGEPIWTEVSPEECPARIVLALLRNQEVKDYYESGHRYRVRLTSGAARSE